MFNDQHNPLLARSRRNRNRGLILSLTAGLVILGAGTLAVSAKPSQQSQEARVERTEVQTTAQAELRGSQTAQTEQRRQVRVIPLFNTPANPTGK